MNRFLVSIFFSLFCFYTISAQVIPEGTYVIRSAVNQNFVVDLDCGVANNGSKVHLWSYYQGAKNQQWHIKHHQGAILIQSEVNHNYVIDLASINAKNGGAIHLWYYHGGNNQKWHPVYDNGAYVLKSADNQNFVVDLDRGNAQNDGLIHLWTYYQNANNQRWIFQRVEGPNNNSNQNGNDPKLHMTLCPGCGGSGVLPQHNYSVCKNCGGSGILSTYQ